MLTKHTSGGVSFVQYSNFCTTPTESGTIRFVLPTKPSPLQFRFGSVAGNCQQTTSLGAIKALQFCFCFVAGNCQQTTSWGAIKALQFCFCFVAGNCQQTTSLGCHQSMSQAV